MPYALFANGNSAFNIRDGSALLNDKAKQIAAAIFGNGPKEADKIGKGVAKQYGKGEAGFNVSSCQFAIHYFFESPDILKGFLKNVAQCTKLNGYFIGTSYDGKLIFNELKNIKKGESIQLVDEGKKVWEIQKAYNADTFEDNSSSINYEINVYQESINQYISEYLVNYDYLTQLLENYGFVLLKRDELSKDSTVDESTGLFTDLFTRMNADLKRNPRLAKEFKDAPNMTPGERQISFFNRYFIYKKVRKVDTENVFLGLTGKTVAEEKDEEDATKRAQAEVLQVEQQTVAAAATATAKPVKVKGKTKRVLKLV